MTMIKSTIKQLMEKSGITLSRHADTGGKRLYLTFDDGPNPEYTSQVLELLLAYQAKATFFLVGDQAERYPQIVRDIIAAGHTIGNHSCHHTRFSKQPYGSKLSEIAATDKLLASIIESSGKHAGAIPFRPPQGIITPGLMYYALTRRRPLCMWSLDSGDYRTDSYENKLTYLQQKPVTAGDIILMHDDNEHTVRLLRHFLPAWKEQGFEFGNL